MKGKFQLDYQRQVLLVKIVKRFYACFCLGFGGWAMGSAAMYALDAVSKLRNLYEVHRFVFGAGYVHSKALVRRLQVEPKY